MCERISRLVCDVMVDHMDGYASPLAVAPALKVFLEIARTDPPREDDPTLTLYSKIPSFPVSMRLYTQKVLPLLAPHYFAFRDELKSVLELFAAQAPESLTRRTFDTIMKYFQLTRSTKAIHFVTLLGDLCEIAPPECVSTVAGAVVLQFTRCATFDHLKVVEAIGPVWQQQQITNWLAANITKTYPIICAVRSQAYDATKTPITRAHIGRMIAVLNRVNTTAYQQAAKRAAANRSPVHHKRRAWSTIIRNASRWTEFASHQILAAMQRTYLEAPLHPRSRACWRRQSPARYPRRSSRQSSHLTKIESGTSDSRIITVQNSDNVLKAVSRLNAGSSYSKPDSTKCLITPRTLWTDKNRNSPEIWTRTRQRIIKSPGPSQISNWQHREIVTSITKQSCWPKATPQHCRSTTEEQQSPHSSWANIE
jgi:hypothetical protein